MWHTVGMTTTTNNVMCAAGWGLLDLVLFAGVIARKKHAYSSALS